MKESLIIPEGITIITEETFTKEELKNIKSITFPQSLQEIGDYAFAECKKIEEVYFQNHSEIKLGDFAFARCEKLKKVCFENRKSINVGMFAFKNTPFAKECVKREGAFILGNTLIAVSPKIKSYEIPSNITRIAGGAFMRSKIESLVIPDAVSVIESNTFECSLIRHIKLPQSLTIIEDYAFCNCKFLEELVIPKTVTEIGRLSLYNIPNCVVTVLNDTEEEWRNDLPLYSFMQMEVFGEFKYLFDNIKEACVKKVRAYYGSRAMRCAKRWGLQFESLGGTPSKYTYIDDDFCCDGTTLVSYLGHEETVWVPDGITEIGPYAFAENYSKSRIIRLPRSVKKICQGAFMWCVSLEAIEGTGVIEIENSAFSNDYNLQMAVFPSLKKVHSGAFSRCPMLSVDEILLRGAFNCEKALKDEEDKLLKTSADYYEEGDLTKAKEYLIRARQISKKRWELNKNVFITEMEKLGLTENELGLP